MTDQSASEAAVVSERDGPLTVLTLNRAKAYNALNMAMAQDLHRELIACDEDDGVRAVLLTGSGDAFCAGGDVRAMAANRNEHGAGNFVMHLAAELHAGIAVMARMRKPVVTAINGVAAGAGFSLAITGDIVLASDQASFTMAYTKIAAAPDGSSTFFLPRLVGPKRAYELAATNRKLSAAEAQDWGLVNQVMPAVDFADQARAYAIRLAEGPTIALGLAKKLLSLAPEASLETQMEHERRAIAACARSGDFLGAIEAFAAKQTPPPFQGR